MIECPRSLAQRRMAVVATPRTQEGTRVIFSAASGQSPPQSKPVSLPSCTPLPHIIVVGLSLGRDDGIDGDALGLALGLSVGRDVVFDGDALGEMDGPELGLADGLVEGGSVALQTSWLP